MISKVFGRSDMKKFLLQVLSLWLIAISFVTFSKSSHHQIIATSDNFSYSQSSDSFTDSATSSNQSGFYASVLNSTSFHHCQQQAYSQQQIESLVYLSCLKAMMGEAEFIKLVNQYHINKYGYSFDYLNNILRHYSFEDLEHIIINGHDLTKMQALTSWNWFCNQKYLRKKKKIAVRERIVQEYDRREKEELRKQVYEKSMQRSLLQEQQKQETLKREVLKQAEQRTPLRFNTQKEYIEQHLYQCGLDPQQCVYLPQDFELLQEEYQYTAQLCKEMQQQDNSSVWSERLSALQKAQDQGFTQSTQEISLSSQARGYLLARDLEPNHYESCYGTALQQRLHVEICDNFELIAQAQHNFLYQSLFLQAATQCADAGYWSNQFESMPLTMHLIDLGKACYQVGLWSIESGPIYAQAMAEGVVESAWDFVHMVRHPGELIQNLSQAAWLVCDTMALADEDSIGATLPFAAQQRQERINTMGAAAQALRDSAINSTGPQRAKMVTKFTADCVFQHKAMQAVGAVAGVLRTQAKMTRTMEYVVDAMGHEPAFAAASESIVQATEELETVLQKSIAEDIVAQKPCKNPMPIRSKIYTLQEVTTKIRKYGGKIPAHDIELVNNTEYWIQHCMKKVQIKIDPALLEEYMNMKQLVGNNEILMSMDLEHIVNCHYELIKDRSGSFHTVKFKGGHSAGTLRKLEKEGIIHIKSHIEFGGGCIEYQAEDIFSGQSFKHTEYPPCWNAEKIAQETKMIFDHYVNEGINLSKGWSRSKTNSELFYIKISVGIAEEQQFGYVKKIKIITSHPVLII